VPAGAPSGGRVSNATGLCCLRLGQAKINRHEQHPPPDRCPARRPPGCPRQLPRRRENVTRLMSETAPDQSGAAARAGVVKYMNPMIAALRGTAVQRNRFAVDGPFAGYARRRLRRFRWSCDMHGKRRLFRCSAAAADLPIASSRLEILTAKEIVEIVLKGPVQRLCSP
jgi:hypothetical protein